jgi:hypothetical protein
LHDGIEFEKRGIPAAVLISSEFVVGAKTMARLQGLPGYPVAVVPHPIGSLTEDGLRERAKVALPQVLDILLKGTT